MNLHLRFYRRLAEPRPLQQQLRAMMEDWLQHFSLESVVLSLPEQEPIRVGSFPTRHPERELGPLKITSKEVAEEDLELMAAQLQVYLRLAETEPLERLMEGLQNLTSTLERKDAMDQFHLLMVDLLGPHQGAVYEGGELTHSWGGPPPDGGSACYPLGPAAQVRFWPEPLPSRAVQLAVGALGFVLKNCELYEEVRSAKRTLEDSQAQIVHSSKLAAVGQLAAGVAHELNSPLGAVMLQLDAAVRNLERQRYEKVADKLDSAEKAAATAKEIISKLLFYSRDATKGLRMVNLNDVVHDTLALLGKQLSYDDLKIELKLQDIPKVQANQNELQQVVTNLLLNARDAVLEGEAGSKVVEVVTRRHDGHVCLEVMDHGPGISALVVDKIFDPFFTTKPVGRGTGLGLSVSHKIMEQHGGQLVAENRPEGGACFRMVLTEHC